MFQKEEVTGLAIICADPRANLWKFSKEKLFKGKVVTPLLVLGGGVCLAHQDVFATEAHFLIGQAHFAVANFPKINKITVVGHDCGFYRMIPRGTFTVADKVKDLEIAADVLRQQFPGLEVEAFFGEVRGKSIAFKKV